MANSGSPSQEFTAPTTAEGELLSHFLLLRTCSLASLANRLAGQLSREWVQFTERDVAQETEDDYGYLIYDGGN